MPEVTEDAVAEVVPASSNIAYCFQQWFLNV
jgi:hypothetical protein